MKTMLINVGGSPEPIIKSILENTPDSIIFFCSKSSRKIVDESINPALFENTKKPISNEIIITEDEENIGLSTYTLLSEVPKVMKKLGADKQWPEIVDYTGGTKVMSAAMVWASSKYPCFFSYIGSNSPEARDKGGVGIVISGKEKCLITENPWNKLAFFEIRDAMQLFNCGQYSNSAELFAKIQEKVSKDMPIWNAIDLISKIVDAYAKWDIFNHGAAISLLSDNINSFGFLKKNYEHFFPNIKVFIEKTEKNFEILKKIKESEGLSIEKIIDLLSNAYRRAKLEKKYDDATARTYAAIEKIAKSKLKNDYNIDTSNCNPEEVPQSIREKLYPSYDGKIKIGLFQAYHLLAELNDPLGTKFISKPEIKNHIQNRNSSILAHGFQPVDKKKFEELFQDALELLKVIKADFELIEFPEFSI